MNHIGNSISILEWHNFSAEIFSKFNFNLYEFSSHRTKTSSLAYVHNNHNNHWNEQKKVIKTSYGFVVRAQCQCKTEMKRAAKEFAEVKVENCVWHVNSSILTDDMNEKWSSHNYPAPASIRRRRWQIIFAIIVVDVVVWFTLRWTAVCHLQFVNILSLSR